MCQKQELLSEIETITDEDFLSLQDSGLIDLVKDSPIKLMFAKVVWQDMMRQEINKDFAYV